MNALKGKYGSKGFEILGFPCNQFHLKEPETNGTDILNVLKYVIPGNGYVPNFQMFTMIQVNGEYEDPLYSYLKRWCGPTSDEFASRDKLMYDPLRINDVRWNFEVFLTNKTGYPVYRYSPQASTAEIERGVEELLKN